MGQTSSQSLEKSTEQAMAVTTTRLFFIDHLRAALDILVGLHHLSIV